MMFPYDSNFLPPAPALEVEIRDPQTGAGQKVLAKLDTGADSSIIPEHLVQSLALTPFDRLLTIAFDGRKEFLTSYLIDVLIAGRSFTDLEVVAAPIPYLLIGRDVLNTLVITLDGSQFTFDIQ